jgi:cytochrome c biogenesis protein CcmG/thiol:disulfide interchange protein DsbE
VLVAAVIAVVAIVGIVAYAATKDEGAEAPALMATTLDGQSFDLAETRGTPTVINFFFASCPPCNAEAPDLVAVSAAHPDVAFLGVGDGHGDSEAETAAFVKKYGIPYPVVYDGNSAIAGDWGVTAWPATFFVDADGVIRDTIVGAATYEQFEASLETIQSGE